RVEKLGDRQTNSGHAGDIVEIEGQGIRRGGNRNAKLDQIRDRLGLEVAWGHRRDRGRSGLPRVGCERQRIGQAVMADVNRDSHGLSCSLHPALAELLPFGERQRCPFTGGSGDEYAPYPRLTEQRRLLVHDRGVELAVAAKGGVAGGNQSRKRSWHEKRSSS